MDAILQRLDKLESHIKVLNEENASNKATIKLLDKRLSESKQTIQSLEEDRMTSSVCTKSHEKLRALKAEVAQLKQQQKQQIQDASNKFKRLDKLQHLMNAAILKNIKVHKGESRMDTLTSQVAAFVSVNQSFDSRLSNLEEKANRFDGSFIDMQKQMESFTKKIASIENVNTATDSRLQLSGKKAKQVDGLLKELEKKIATNESAIGQVQSYQDIVEKTVFHADLEEGIALATNVTTRLNSCTKVYLANKCFDARTAFFNVPADGVYLFNVTVEQKHPGGLRVGVGPENETPSDIAVTHIETAAPDSARDSRSASIIMGLSQGKRVCVQATRIDGQAKVSWCRFTGCLLSLSTQKRTGASASSCSVS